jgi:ribonuclease HI
MCERQKVGGWAAWLKCSRRTEPHRAGAPFSVRVKDTAMAESMAVVNALSSAIRTGFVEAGDEILIQTDNDSVMGVLEGTAVRTMSKAARIRKGLTKRQGKRVVAERNAEIAMVSAAFLSMTASCALRIRWRHVKGHRGAVDPRSAVNSYCDRTARAHMRAARGMQVPTMMERHASRGGGTVRNDGAMENHR